MKLRKGGYVAPNPWAVRASYKPLPAVQSTPDDPELVAAYRAETERRMAILRAERAKLVDKRGKLKPTSKLTLAEREHLNSFGFTSEQVRAGLQ